MAARESINRIKIEDFRFSKCPINPLTTIYQGDMLAWDASTHRAVPHVAASGAEFLGIAEGQNPIPSMGVLLDDQTVSRINVIQQALVELIFDESAMVYPGDLLTIGTTSVQHVKKTGATSANVVGIVADENDFGSAGKALVAGNLVLMWLRVPVATRRNQ